MSVSRSFKTSSQISTIAFTKIRSRLLSLSKMMMMMKYQLDDQFQTHAID